MTHNAIRGGAGVDLRQPTDDKKMKELILYICRKSEGDEKFGAIKLNKILFFSDYAAYLHLGKSITGHEYRRLKKGPAPRKLPRVREALINEGRLFVKEVEYYKHKQHKHLALTSPDLSSFNGEEIALVDIILERMKDMDATDSSNVSHDFLGWLAARPGETIPYEMVYINNRGPTIGELERARELEEEALGCLSN